MRIRAHSMQYVLDVALERDLALGRARELARELPHALGLARDRLLDLDQARFLYLDQARFLDRTRVRARDLALDIDRDLGHARDLSRDLSRTLDTALDFDRTDEPFAVFIAFKRVQAVAAELCGCLEDAVILTESKQFSRRRSAGKREQFVVSPLAQRLTGAAVLCLPVTQRARYREEYHAELHEIAGTSRRAQWRYAANLLICAWPLRRELRRSEGKPAPNRWSG